MVNVIWATPLYKFLRYCDSSPLEKLVLDCGAGGDDPPLQLFHEKGYKTWGVEVSDEPFKQAKSFCKKQSIELNILKGDMRHLPFKSSSFSFVYSFNAIFFMTKKDIAISMKEIERVLRRKGLCFVNFVSVDDPDARPFCKPFLGNLRFSQLEDDEADQYFRNFELIHKEKRIIGRKSHDKWLDQAYIDYIAQKK